MDYVLRFYFSYVCMHVNQSSGKSMAGAVLLTS